MSNVLPTGEQKRVWSFYRTRFILVGATTLSIVAGIVLISLVPTYVMLRLNRTSTPDTGNVKKTDAIQNDGAEALKTQLLISQLLPTVSSTSTPIDAIASALDGKPADVHINHISYKVDSKQRTIVLAGSAQNREGINLLRKELMAKGIYSSVTVPVSDLVGASGNQFTVTLISPVH